MTRFAAAQQLRALTILTVTAGCGASSVPLYKGLERSSSAVALLNTGEGLLIERVYTSDGSMACSEQRQPACPAEVALLPGRYRVIARPARWPSSPRRWAIDVDLAAAQTYAVRVTARQVGEGSSDSGPDFGDSYQTAVEIADVWGRPVAAGIPEQESAPLPPGQPLKRDPKAPRCPPYSTAADSTALPPSWYSKGQPRLQL